MASQNELALYLRLKDELSKEFQNAARKVEGSGRGMEMSLTQATKGAQAGLRSMVSGITAVSAAAAGAEKSVAMVGMSLLTAFASGGPAALGIAAVGAAIGTVVGHFRSLNAEQEREAEIRKKTLEDLREEVRQRRALVDLMNRLGREPTKGELSIDDIQKRINAKRAEMVELEKVERSMRDPKSFLAYINAQDRIRILGGEIESLGRQFVEQDRLLRIEEQRKKVAEDQKRESDRVAAAAGRQKDEWKAVAEWIGSALARLREMQAVAARQALGDMLSSAVDAPLNALRSLVRRPAAEAPVDRVFLENQRALDNEIALIREQNAFRRERLRIEQDLKAELERIAALGVTDPKDVVRLQNRARLIARERAGDVDDREAESKARAAQPFVARGEDLERDLVLLRESNDLRRDRLAIDQEIHQEIVAVQAAFLRGEIGAGTRDDMVAKLEEMRELRQRLVEDEFTLNLRSVGPQLSATWADLVRDGITTGFRSAADIGRNLLLNLGSQFTQLGFNALLSGIPGLQSLFPRGTAAAMGGVFPTGDSPVYPVRYYAAGGITRGPEVVVRGEGSKREAVVPLPDGRTIPVEMRGGGGVHVDLGGVHIGGGGDFLSLPVGEQERIILAHVERALHGRYAQAIAARSRSALV